MTAASPRPARWDLASILPAVDSPEYRRAVARLGDAATALHDALDRAGSNPTAATIDAILITYNAALADAWHIESFVLAHTDTDATDDQARAAASTLRPILARVTDAGHRLADVIGTLDLDSLASEFETIRRLTYPLQRLLHNAPAPLPSAAETLAAALHASSGAAWTQLSADISATLAAPLPESPDPTPVPIPALRRMGTDPDRTVRQRAFRAESSAWASQAVPLAAALNAIVGEKITLARRRGWPSLLDAALHDHGIDRETLDALLAATGAALPELHRYPVARARLLGRDHLAPYDRFAPLEPAPPALDLTYPAAAALVRSSLRAFSPTFGAVADRAIAERWIDAEPRPGKRGGGLCYWFNGGISRIRLEYHPAVDSIRTLAHEIGHAIHAALLDGAGALAMHIEATPPPLAETASKLCERLVLRGLLGHAATTGDPAAVRTVLDGTLAAAYRSVVHSLELFRLESALVSRRQERDLTVSELKAISVSARISISGDTGDPAEPDPWTWAATPQLYLNSIAFYNLPYLIAQLLALSLIARVGADPSGLPATVETFLAQTGHRAPTSLAADLGLDLHSSTFWQAGLAILTDDIASFAASIP